MLRDHGRIAPGFALVARYWTPLIPNKLYMIYYIQLNEPFGS